MPRLIYSHCSIFIEREMHAWVVQVIFYQHFFLTGFFRQCQSLLTHLGYYLKLQIITYHCMIHACLMVCTCTPDITRLSLDYCSTYFAIVVGYALMSYVKACVLLVSQQFAKRLPKIFNMTLACCILLPLMVHILLCGWCWIPENATGTKRSDNMPCLHKPSHFQLSVISLVVVLSQSRDIASLYVQSKLKMKM